MIRLSSYTKFLWIGGYGLMSIFQDGRIEVYSGTQPADADAAKTGTLLGTITQNGAAFTAGVRANGALQLKQSTYGVLVNDGSWKLTVTTSGTAGWFRYHGNYADSNALDSNKVHIRLDGTVSQDAELKLSTNTLTAGQVIPVVFGLQMSNL